MMCMQCFPLKLIMNMEIFSSKLKFESTFYQKLDYEHLVKINDNDSVLRPVCRRGWFLRGRRLNYGLTKIQIDKINICWKISKWRWNYIINFHVFNFSKGYTKIPTDSQAKTYIGILVRILAVCSRRIGCVYPRIEEI